MKGPRVIALCFTNRCNLKCKHCGCDPTNANPLELPTSFFLGVLKQAKDLGAETVNVSGGEAFVRTDCLEMIEGAIDLGYYVTMESNGTLLKPEDISRFASMGNRIRLSLSLDGLTAKVNDAIRGKGSFEKEIATIRLAAKAKLPARVITVLNTGNISQIPDIAHYIVDELGLSYRLIPSIMEYGRGAHACETYGVSWDKACEVLEGFYYDFLRKHNSSKHSVGLNLALIPPDIESSYYCAWGEGMIGIGPSGQVSLCHDSINDPRYFFGDLTKESLRSILENSVKLAEFRDFNPDRLLGICGNCLCREVCRGGCRVEALSKYSGEFFAPSPCCQSVYELGRFPIYAMENEEKDCHYST